MIEEYYIPSSLGSDKKIFVKIKTKNGYKNPLITLAGRSMPFQYNVDVVLGGISFCDLLAENNITTICLNYLGTGNSSKYDDDEVHCTYNDVYRDALDVVNWFRKEKNNQKISIYGNSGSSIPVLMLGEKHPDLIENVFMHSIANHTTSAYVPDDLPKTFKLNYEHYRKRRYKGIPEEEKEQVFPEKWLDDFDKVIREGNILDYSAPNGADFDKRDIIRGIKKFSDWFEWSNIKVPIQMICGEYDFDSDNASMFKYYEECTNAPHKNIVVIPKSTHFGIQDTGRNKIVNLITNFIFHKSSEYDRKV
jgi:pimeloyl-ACP methyl ester carboxylesterase